MLTDTLEAQGRDHQRETAVLDKRHRQGNPLLSFEAGGGPVDSRLAAMAGIGIGRVRLLRQLDTGGAIPGLHLRMF